MKKATKDFVDPKEQLVSHENLERYNQRLRNKTAKAREKRSPPSDDDDINMSNMGNDYGQQMTPQGKKKTKTNSDLYLFNKKSNANQDPEQHLAANRYTTNGEQSGQFNISSQALLYAVENNFSAIKIECSPPLESREHAKKFVINFFKYIEKDFRKNYPGNQQPLGFHHWWTDSAGKMLYGVTNDIDLYIYLCNQNRYPTQIDKVKLKPDPPKRLPPQQTVVIKFVPNELQKEEIQDELKELFPSLFTIDNMMGTMRSSSRHIRGEFYSKEDYNKIINDGKIGLQGQIFEVEEYLPPPKILICSKCNTPGHMKRTCQEKNEICRRCGQCRNDGKKHDECLIKCHHCGGEHMSNNYKCPTIVKFRQDLLTRLKHDRNKLPPNVKIFIPVDCRVDGDRNRFLTSQNDHESNDSVPSNPPTINPWTTRQYINNETSNNNIVDPIIKSFANELVEIKKNFEIERERIKTCHEQQIKSIQQGWLMIQQQVQAQNQCLTLMSAMIKDNVTAIGQLVSTISSLNETIKSKCTNDLDYNKIDTAQMIINATSSNIKNLYESFANHENTLSLIMNKQSTIFGTALDSFLPTKNG